MIPGTSLSNAGGKRQVAAFPELGPEMLLSNYLFFTSDCEQALGFYTACGLGRVTTLVRHGETAMPPPAMQRKVMVRPIS